MKSSTTETWSRKPRAVRRAPLSRLSFSARRSATTWPISAWSITNRATTVPTRNPWSTTDHRRLDADLLPHEFVHSWNGKYRRPAGLATPDYSEPMKGELLWVYEGLTEYLGEILTPRSGLLTPQDFFDSLAREAAALDTRGGPHLASAGGYRRSRPVALRRPQRLRRPAAQHRLLRGRHPDLAGSRCHHPHAQQGHEIARRFLQAFAGAPSHATRGEALHIRRRGARLSTPFSLTTGRVPQ